MFKDRRIFKRIALGVMTAGLLGSGPALAHHSFAMFDMSTTKAVSGAVTDFQWTNPHTWIWLNAPTAAGGVELWGVEGMSPNFLERRGWSKTTLKVGDKVTVFIHPLKDGGKGGSFVKITLPDGKEMNMMGAYPGGGASANGPTPGGAPPQ